MASRDLSASTSFAAAALRAGRSTAGLVVGFGVLALACTAPSTDPFSPATGSGGVTSGTGGSPSSAGSGGTGVVPADCASPPPAAPLSLLTRVQYDNTVLDLLADDSAPARTLSFPPENQVLGFNNNTSAHQANPLLVEKYLEAAEALAARAVQTRLAEIAPCAADAASTSCGMSFVRVFGESAFRRGLTDAEAAAFDGLFSRTLATADYATAVGLTLQAMLQSPQFLYRTDSLRAPSVEAGAVPLGSFELASRLSYFLTDSMPDPELLTAARENRLSTDVEIETAARRLLETPRAREVVRSFHRQWLGLESLAATTRSAPELGIDSVILAADWLGSFDRFVDQVYWERGNVAALFDSKTVFVTPRLATLYGVAAPAAEYGAVELQDRAGFLTQPAWLALLAHEDQSAPVLRGVFVRERVMCLEVDPPPPNVMAVPPDPDPNLTTRELFRVHTESIECAGCHTLIDGIGFGFEQYDQLGRYREIENGIEVDASGSVVSTGDPSLDGPFVGVPELSARLGASRRVQDCLATSWYRYAFGRSETADDACSLDQVKTRFAAAGGDLPSLLVALVSSDAFRYRAPLPEDMKP